MKAFLFLRKLIFLKLLILIICQAGYCTDYTWRSGASTSNWEDPSNWTPLPTKAFTNEDNITIAGGTKMPVISSMQTIGKLTISIGSLTISSGFILNATGMTSASAGTFINGSGTLIIGAASLPVGASLVGVTVNCTLNGFITSLNLRNNTFSESTTLSFKVYNTTGYFGIGGNNFNGPVVIESAGISGVRFSDVAVDQFNNDLTLISTVGLISTSFNYSTNYNGNIIVKSNGGSGVYFGNSSTASTASSNLANGKTIIAQDFRSGSLTLKNFIQADSSISQTITLDSLAQDSSVSTAALNFLGNCSFKGILTAKAPNMMVSGGIYYNNCSFTKVGGTVVNSSSGIVTFKKDVIFNSNGGIWYICANTGLYRFEGNAYFYKNSGSFYALAYNAGSSVEFDNPGKTILISNNGGGGTISFANSGNLMVKGNVIFRSNTSLATTFGGTGLTILKDGASLSIDSARFTNGGLTLKGITQEGNSKQVLRSSFGTLTFGINSTFEGVVNTKFPNINFNGTVFKDSLTAERTGSSNLTSDGGNSFYGPVKLTSSGTGFWYLANVNPDKFYDNTIFIRTSSPNFDIVRTATSEFYKDVVFKAGNLTDPIIGSGSGKMIFKGDSAQTISYDKTTFIRLDNIILNKTSNHVTLNANIQVNGSIQFIKGNLITSASKLIKINTANLTGASSLSYVEGPAQKLGNAAFTFPIGKDGIYKPISISAPLSSDLVTAEVFNAAPPGVSLLSAPITSLALCQYWKIGRTLSTSLTVTLPWDVNTCTTVDPSIVKLARYNGAQWTDASSGAGTGTSSSGSISSNSLTITGANNYFTFGNLVQAILKINTVNVNTGNFTITGPGMVALDTLSGLSSSIVTLKPDLPAFGAEKSIVLTIPQNTERKSLEMRVTYNNSSAITKVEAKFDNQYFPLNSDYYRIKDANELQLYKEAPEPEVMTISTNLRNGILLDTSGVFQVNIPSNTVFSGSILSVYNISGTTPVQVYGPQSVLSWDASAATDGVYEFQLQLTATGGDKIYKGQFIKE